jgi:hypothetical protein
VTSPAVRRWSSPQKSTSATNDQDPNAGGLSRKHIMDAIDDSLRRLGMEYVDLYQIHRWDYTTPIEETMEALHDVVKAGKARYIGASSMYAWQFAKAQNIRRAQWLDPFHLHAEPLQSDLPRGRTGDDTALSRPGCRAYCRGARWHVASSPVTAPGEGKRRRREPRRMASPTTCTMQTKISTSSSGSLRSPSGEV